MSKDLVTMDLAWYFRLLAHYDLCIYNNILNTSRFSDNVEHLE